jgi:hypothetical protein
MEEINIRKVLNMYKMFSKRQREVLGKLIETRESFTFEDLQQALQDDPEAKEILQKIHFVADGEYEKAGISKPASKPESSDNDVKKIDLMM